MVIGWDFNPAMIPDEPGFELLKPTMRASICGAEGLGGREWYAGPLSPFVHVLHITREDNLGFGLRCIHVGVVLCKCVQTRKKKWL